MNKDQKHKAIGLTQEEFAEAVRKGGAAQVGTAYEEKLENCDLSRSAMELVNEKDLQAVVRISNEVNNQYLSVKRGGAIKKLTLIGAVLSVIIVSVIYLNHDPKVDISQVGTHSQKEQIKNNPVPQSKAVDKALAVKRNENTNENHNNVLFKSIEKEPDEVVDSNLITPVDKYLGVDSSAVKEKLKQEDKKEVVHHDEPEEVATKEKVAKKTSDIRTVKDIFIQSAIDPKYRNDSYSISELVSYDGGHDGLGREIFTQLRQKIKYSDIPVKNNSVVFKFEVTSRGKVKNVNIQSLATDELQLLIKEVASSLSGWQKGSKRASMTYTVTVSLEKS